MDKRNVADEAASPNGVAAPHPTLMDALLAVQAEAPALQKTKLNPAFRSKYVSLDSLMGDVMPIINAHGLVWVTLPGRDETGDPALTYRMIHAATGEALTGSMPLMLAKTDPQGQGSAITYARRYSIMAVLGLVADEDDDDNKASPRAEQKAKPAARPATNGNGVAAAPRPLTTDELDKVMAAIDRAGEDPELMCAAVGVVDRVTTEHAKKIRALLDKKALPA